MAFSWIDAIGATGAGLTTLCWLPQAVINLGPIPGQLRLAGDTDPRPVALSMN